MAKDFVQMDLFPIEVIPELPFHEIQKAKIAERDGISPKCKHLSLWNKKVCDNCGDCEYVD